MMMHVMFNTFFWFYAIIVTVIRLAEDSDCYMYLVSKQNQEKKNNFIIILHTKNGTI